MSGTTDNDNIGSSQSGTANTAMTLNGRSVTETDNDGLVDAETLGSAGDLTIDGVFSSRAGASSEPFLNSFLTINSANNLSGVEFNIVGTDIDGNSISETITGPTAGSTVVTTNIFKTISKIETDGSVNSVNVGTKAVFVDVNGKRPSITSTGGDESSKTFTIVGTDMSGNAQTEVITGPASSATAIGSKTFKTITSITPSANTTGSVTLGFSGTGVTTTGVTGSATLDGVSMSADIYNNQFTAISGNGSGIKVTYSGLGANGTVYYGDSFIFRLTDYIDNILNSSDSTLNNRETRLNTEVSTESTKLSDLDIQYENIKSRYMQQFSAMEKAVTSMKSTGEYLTSLFEAMSKDD